MRIAFAILLAVAGCGGATRDFGHGGTGGDGGGGGSGGSGGTGGSGGGGGSPDMAPPLAVYPAGPYGHQAGQTMPNLTMPGYRLTPTQTDSTQLSWDTNISFNDYHSNPQCKCLLVTLGALWCGACQQEQPALVSDVSGDPSFCVLGILQEGQNQGVAATKADVDTWTQYFMENFAVAQGSSATDNLFSGFGPTIGLPFSFVVKPDTMKVLDTVQGFDTQIHDYAMGLCNAN